MVIGILIILSFFIGIVFGVFVIKGEFTIKRETYQEIVQTCITKEDFGDTPSDSEKAGKKKPAEAEILKNTFELVDNYLEGKEPVK